jgi:prepilin-type N-terminal cleavage/methylation domain-containing protein
MKARSRLEAGFTLVEIMIVVAIVGLLCAMAIPSFVNAREQSRLRTCVNNLRQVNGAKDQWALEAGKATGDACAMSDIMPYLRRSEPKCPIGSTAYLVNNIGTAAECNSSSKADHNAAYGP